MDPNRTRRHAPAPPSISWPLPSPELSTDSSQQGSGVAVSQAASLEIDDFSYLDTSGEPHASAHEIKLQAFMTALRRVSRPTIGIISLPPPASHPVLPTDR